MSVQVEHLTVAALNESQKPYAVKCIKPLQKVGDDMSRRYTFNTVVAANMELLNDISRFNDDSVQGQAVRQDVLWSCCAIQRPD